MKLTKQLIVEIVEEVMQESLKKPSAMGMGMKRGKEVSEFYYTNLEKEKNEKIETYKRELKSQCSNSNNACQDSRLHEKNDGKPPRRRMAQGV